MGRVHPRPAGQVLHGQRTIQAFDDPGEQRRERVVVPGGYRGGDELRLATGPVRRHDQTAGDGVGDGRTVVEADEVQTQVQRGGLARGGEHAAVVHVEHIRSLAGHLSVELLR